jgi:FG-GAP-like repeat
MRACRTLAFLSPFLLGTGFVVAQTNLMTRNYSATLSPAVINRGDFNNDGILDLIAGNVPGTGGQVSVYLGNADGTFQAARNSTPGAHVNDLAVADFNHDGKLDVAVSSIASNVVTVLLGNGDGTFGEPQSLTVPNASYVESLTVGDFNHDGNPDIAVGFGSPYAPGDITGNGFTYQPNTITIFPGQTNGSFGAPIQFTGMGQSALSKIRVGDFNADGNIDLAVQTLTDIYILLGNGNFTFNQQLLTSYYQTTDITPADVNQDGFTDLIVSALGCSGNCGSLDVFLSQGQSGTLQKSATLSLTSPLAPGPVGTGKVVFEPPYAPVAIDLNGDGIKDIVAANHDLSTAYDEITAWLGNPDGTYQSTPLTWVLGTEKGVSGMVAGDFNRDGKIDVATANESDSTIGVDLNAITPMPCQMRTAPFSVTVCQPVDYTYSTSPVRVVASASPGSSPILAGQVYLDNSPAFQTTGSQINTALNLAPGDHLLATKFLDMAGQNSIGFTHVSAFIGTPGKTCTTAPQTLTICLPGQNVTVASPLHVLAAVMVDAPVTAFQVYIDGALVYNDTKFLDNYVDTAFTLPSGMHYLVFKAFDAEGRTFSSSRNIAVQ